MPQSNKSNVATASEIQQYIDWCHNVVDRPGLFFCIMKYCRPQCTQIRTHVGFMQRLGSMYLQLVYHTQNTERKKLAHSSNTYSWGLTVHPHRWFWLFLPVLFGDSEVGFQDMSVNVRSKAGMESYAYRLPWLWLMIRIFIVISHSWI